jgi:putative MATE family efflux protein
MASARRGPAAAAARYAFYACAGAELLRVAHPSPHDAEIRRLALPAALALALEPAAAAVDAAWAGACGTSTLGAVGLGGVLFTLPLAFFTPLVFATTPRVAAAVAAHDPRRARRAAAAALWVAAIAGAPLGFALWAGAPHAVAALAGDPALAAQAVLYLRARAWGSPAALASMAAVGAARGHGFSPVSGALAYLIALAALDAALIGGLGMGAEGAGWAGAASQYAGASALVWSLARRGALELGDLRRPPPLRAAAAPFLAVAPELALNSAAALAPTLAATAAATALGPTALAAHTVLRQISAFWGAALQAWSAAAIAMTATNLGAGRAGAAPAAAALARAAQLAVALAAPAAAALYLARAALPRAFTSDAAVVAQVEAILPALLLYIPLDALGAALDGAFLGAADARWVARRAAAASAASLAALAATGALGGGLGWTWAGLKLLNAGALAADLGRLAKHAHSRRRAAPRRSLLLRSTDDPSET